MRVGAVCRQLSGFIDEAAQGLDDQMAFAKRAGLDAVDIRTVWGKNVTALSPDELSQVRAAAADHGLAISCVGSPVNKVSATADQRPVQMDLLKRSVDACVALGAPAVRVFTPSVNDQGRPEDWPLVEDWMTPQVELVAGAGITFLHENDGRFWGAFPACCRILLEHFAGPRFGAIYDPSNAVLIGYRTMRDWLPWLLPHIRVVHVKDSIEEGSRIVKAGEGEGEFPELLAHLSQAGWSGGFAMEPHLAVAGSAGGFSGEEAFIGAIDALKQLFEKEAD